MKVGFTFDLRTKYLSDSVSLEESAELDSIETVEAIEQVMSTLGLESDRIGGAEELVHRLGRGERWPLVFNFSPGVRGSSREAQVPSILDVFDIPHTFSDAQVTGLTQHKASCKYALMAHGVPTAALSLHQSSDADIDLPFPFPVFAKPVSEGSSKGVYASSRIDDKQALQRACEDLHARFSQAVLIEPFLEGREFTVGIIGTGREAGVIGVMEVLIDDPLGHRVYSYRIKEELEKTVSYKLVDDREAREAGRIALNAWKLLGCRDGGRVDVRSDRYARPQIIEVNPLPGLHPTHSDLPIMADLAGVGYESLIASILRSAMSRAGLRGACSSGISGEALQFR